MARVQMMLGSLLIATVTALSGAAFAQGANSRTVPRFEPQPFWPKPLPSNWILGQVSGIAVDRNDHIWIIHRPGTLLDDEKGAQKDPPATKCCTAAPPVLKFDGAGNLLASWGGPGQGYDWPKSEHGIFVDKDGNVWIAGNDKTDDQIRNFLRWKIPPADRQARRALRLEHARRSWQPSAHDRRRSRGRTLCRRRLSESPRHRVRRQERRLQAPLGRLWHEDAERRETSRL